MAAQNKINQLISESEVSSTSGNLIDQHVKLPVTEIIKVKDEFINHLLGISLEAKYMQRLLQSIELDVANQDGNFEVKVPSWRQDIKIAQDIVEEVGRLNGYDNIVNQLPTRNLTPTNLSKIEILAKRITNILSVSGAYEVLTYSGVSLDLLKKSSQDESMAFKIKNAISPQLQAMRLSLLPSLLEKVHSNIKQGYEEFAIFEIGKTHIKSMILDDGLPRELPAVAWVFSASTKQAGLHDGASYYQAKKYLSHLMKQLGVEDWRIEPIKTGDDWLDIVSGPVSKNRSGQIVVDKTVIGLVGEFNPNVKKAFKLSNFTAGFELNLERLLEISGNIKPYQPSSRYPSVEQDITFVVSRGETFEAVTKLMLDLFDINEIDILVQPLDAFAKETDKSNKNLTFRIRLQRYDRTMTTQEANDIVDSMVSKLEQSIKAKRI
jgi:phenylalanyl-tRNA synthetase beta chain